MNVWQSELLNEFTEEFAFMNYVDVDDGYGGYTQEWREGAHFTGILLKSNENQDLVSGAQTNTTFYGIKIPRNVPMEYKTVFKRLSDGKTFRCKADEGMRTPSFSQLDIRQMPIEEWVIPTDGSNG